MENRQTIDAKILSRMFLAGAKNLEAKKEWINELNVFPVPDGDTGTNMTLTILSAVAEVTALEDPDMEKLAKAISSGSLKGARGNSGVILSQLLRGFTRGVAKYNTLDSVAIAAAMEKAVETAYKAVMKPKEGTILTVAREAALKASQIAEETASLEIFFREIFDHSQKTLEQTPEMLPVLKKAGGAFELYKDKHSLAVGAMDGTKYKEYTIQLEKGDQLFLYTDGVPEASNAREEMFGIERMLQALNSEPETDPEKLLHNVREAVSGFAGEAEQFDDLTMMGFTYNGTQPE